MAASNREESYGPVPVAAMCLPLAVPRPRDGIPEAQDTQAEPI